MKSRLFMIVLIVVAANVAATGDPDDEMDFDDVVEQTRQWGVEKLFEKAREPMEVDDRTTEVDPEDLDAEDDTLYLQHMIPGYGTERNERVFGTLQAIAGDMEQCDGLSGDEWDECYEENQPTPAELPRLAEDHNRQLAEGENPQSKAYQTARSVGEEQPRFQFHHPDEGFHDPILRQAEDVITLESPLYESIVGDCESVTHITYESEFETFDDDRTCTQLFAPDPDEFACSAERAWSATAGERRVVAQLTPLVDEAACEEESLAAALACQDEQCPEVGEINTDICMMTQCGGLEGDDLEACQEECEEEGESAESACLAGNTGCDDLQSAKIDLCINEQCDPDNPSADCIIECNEQYEGFADECNEDCEDDADDAMEQCMEEAGEEGTFDGTASYSVPTLGFNAGTSIVTIGGREFELYRNPFAIFANAENPSHFSGAHQVEVDGGAGQVNSFGVAPSFRSNFTFSGEGVTQIRLVATLASIQENRIDGCEEYMDIIADGFCQGEFICTNDQSPSVQVAEGIWIDENGPSATLTSVLHPWHSDKIGWGEHEEMAPRMCWAANSSDMECNYYLGSWEDECYIDEDGEEQCPNCYIDVEGNERCIDGEGIGLDNHLNEPTDQYLDNCAHHLGNPDCGSYEIHTGAEDDQPCVEGGLGPVTERCYVRDVVFDCGETHEFERVDAIENEISCEGDIRCMGNECVAVEEEVGDPREAIEATSILREGERDSTCLQEDEDTPISEIGEDCEPVFFRGDAKECKIPIGSNIGLTPDCCDMGLDAAEDEDFASYMDGMSAAYNAGTNPAEAGELGNITSRDGDEGSNIDTPDWMDLRDRTIYVPPGGDDDDDDDGGGGESVPSPASLEAQGGARAKVAQADSDDGGDYQAQPIYINPHEMGPASSDEANYVSRRFVSPFEANAAQHGYVPTNPEELETAKTAATADRDDSPINFARAMGLGAMEELHPDLADALFFEDGTPRYVVSRSSSPQTAESFGLAAAKPDPSRMQAPGGGGLQATAGSAVTLGGNPMIPPGLEAPSTFQSFASVASVIGKAYAVYSILRTIGHLVYRCEADEIELGFARQTRRCTYVGKYCNRSVGIGPLKTCIETREVHCCYNSPFGRILMEEVRDNDGMGFGSPKEPNCEGLTAEQLAQVDFDRVDLGEWYAMLNMAGHLPDQGSDDDPPGPDGFGGGLMSFVGTTKGTRDVPETGSRRTVQVNVQEHLWTPRRAIPGTNVGTAGPDGLISTRNRAIARLQENATAIEASRNLLAQRTTEQHNPELIKWYHETTHSPDPARNPDLDIGDDIGDPDEEQLPDFCDDRGPPEGFVRVTTDRDGNSLSDITVPENDQENHEIRLEADEYISLELEMPTEGWFGATVWDDTFWGSNLIVQEGEINLAKCPGYFGDDLDANCRDYFSGERFNAHVRGMSGWERLDCPGINPGETYFVNVRAVPNDDCVGSCNFVINLWNPQ